MSITALGSRPASRDETAGHEMPVPAWHALSAAEVAARLAVQPDQGLSGEEVRRRLLSAGPNRVADQPETPLWQLWIRQFRSLVVLLLLLAAGIAAVLGERAEAVAILAALGLNAAIGFGTEWHARRSLARLRALSVLEALTRRDGRLVRLPAADLVPGDVVVLEAGARVPADARLLHSTGLQVMEAALTGESEPVDKDAETPLAPDTPLAERRTMAYLGTTAVAGSGLAIVTGTGLATEVGRIGQLVALAGERLTPLERQVEELGRKLIGLAVAICGIVGLAGILHGEPIGLMLETAISLAVAAIPEGLPAVTAVALAAGLWRLARAGALVRRLPAVETLGSTTVICADKTGTMTENRMTVTRLYLEGRIIEVGGEARSATGSFHGDGALLDPGADRGLMRLLTVAALVNNASVEPGPDGLVLHGDPTETALLIAALKAGLDPAGLARRWTRRCEIPFDPTTRVMATFHDCPEGGRTVCVKGAPAVVLAACSRRQAGAATPPLDGAERTALLDANRELAGSGFRVLAVAWQPGAAAEDGHLANLTFLGFVALEDPVRAGVGEAIARCGKAGIRTIMLTGDQRSTAEAVGRALGLAPTAVQSRVTPEGKLDLVRALQGTGEIVAMTGDGVNDAPALARADIGIAMGRHGTDVARDAADLVLTDDNFATIVGAVREGRVIYANLRKVVHFLFSCNLSEILTIFVAIVLGFPSPLLPLQILWINLVTDILPAVALIRDPAEPNIMRRPPRDPREPLVSWQFGARMLGEGALLAAGVLSAYLWTLWWQGPGTRATTVAFVSVVLVHPLQAMNCRSERYGWWRLPRNGFAWLALVTLVAVQWVAIQWAPLAGLLHTTPLPAGDWLLMAAAVLWPIAVLEVAKARRR